jgi:phage terminase small subunit
MIHNTTNKKPHRRTYKNNEDVFITETGHPLTANEAKFIDEYIKTGNKKQSYTNAYPNANPNTAAQLAQKVFNKDYIAAEIKFRLEKMKSESIAEADEIMQYLTAVMRGQIKDQFGLDASLSERTKAAMELAKRKIDIQQKMAVNEQPEVRIVLDWSRDNDTKANISMQ